MRKGLGVEENKPFGRGHSIGMLYAGKPIVNSITNHDATNENFFKKRNT